jgi:tight adherence protein C
MQYLVAVLVFVAIVSIGGAILNREAARRRAIRSRLLGGGQGEPPPEREGRRGILRPLSRLGTLLSSGKASGNLADTLAKAGFRDKSAPSIYMGLKVVLMIIGVVAAAILTAMFDIPLMTKVLALLAGASLMFFIPNVVVRWRQKRRAEQVRHCLPDAIDLLEVCLSSGMSLDAAWNLVANEIRHVGPYLADEMALADLEIHLGATREEALRHMAARTDAQDLSSLVAVLVQSERFGTAMADALRAFATSLREERTFRAEEAGEKVAVKLLFPLVVFLFPAIFIVLAGPAALALAKMMSRG